MAEDRREGNTCAKHPTYAVSPGYFQAMGIALTEGREFEAGRSAAEVIVNDTFARAQWPNEPALGQVMRIGDRGESVTVVGVTGRTATRGIDRDRERPSLFIPVGREHYEGSLTMVVRTAGNPLALVRPVEEAADAVDPNVALLGVKTMEQRMAVQMWPFRTLSLTLLICGGLAVMLATVGLAGIVIHSVSRRTREFGVRMSVGATPRDLMRDVLASGIWMLVPGLIAGLVFAATGARLMQVIFVGVNVLNPITYLAVALLQSAIVVLACIWPALRASRVDPLIALRAE